MRRPNWRGAMFAAVSGAIGLSVLAGCGTHQYAGNPNDQAAHYLQAARGNYVIPGPPSDPWGPYIREASKRFDVPETWIRALMRQESGGNLYRNGRLITSGAGAMGLMQVMPGTYAELRSRHNLGPDPFDPHENIMAGVAYMREMYDMYGAPGFLAAYNAGPNRLDDYLSNQRSLPDETRHYVAAIGPSLRYAQPNRRSPAEQFVMNQLPLNIPPGPRFGYGSSQIPTTQLASARPAYAAPSYAAPAYAPQPRALAYAPQPAYAAPRPAYAAPAPQARTLAWAEPPRQAFAPAPFHSQSRDDDDDDAAPAHRTAHAPTPFHPSSQTRMAMAIPPVPPSQKSGGLHLISSAMAAETYPVHHRGHGTHASYSTEHSHNAAKPHSHASTGCHTSHGKKSCGSA